MGDGKVLINVTFVPNMATVSACTWVHPENQHFYPGEGEGIFSFPRDREARHL